MAFPVGTTFRKDPCVADELLGDGSMVLYSGCRQKTLTLNGTGALIWECCDSRHTVEGMAAEIRDVFPDGRDIERSVRQVLDDLLRDGMILVDVPSNSEAAAVT